MNKLLILFSVIAIFIVFYNYYNTIESYLNIDYCPKCHDLWEGKCNNCNNCGWCIDSDYYGQCMPGDKNGPYKNKFCRKWYYDGICMDGPECGRVIRTYRTPAWWRRPFSFWGRRPYYRGGFKRPFRRSFKRPYRRSYFW